MNVLIFFRYIYKEFPLLLFYSIGILIVTGLIETVTLLFIAPIVDILISSDLQSTSPISKKMGEILTSIGLPVTIGVLFTFYIILIYVLYTFYWFSQKENIIFVCMCIHSPLACFATVR